MTEIMAPMTHLAPECCGAVMGRLYSFPALVKYKYPLWVDRIDDIQRRETDNGGRMRLPHPSEVQAT